MPFTGCVCFATSIPPPQTTPAASNEHCFSETILWHQINRPSTTRPLQHRPRPIPLLSSSTAALERRAKADTLPLRTGALAIKKGMTAIFDTETGQRIPCTVLQLDGVQVVAHKTRKRHGYWAVCVGSGFKKAKNVSKPMLGHYSVQGVSPKRHLHEFRVKDKSGLLDVGEEIKADWFLQGQFVDTRSNCKGKGFQGVMKRWGMHGQDRSHGVSLTHRSMGSAGQGQGGGSRVYPGKKMAGNMGGQRNTVQSLRVMMTDAEKGIVVVNGAVSGPKGVLVMLQDALKKPWPAVPAQVKAEPAPPPVSTHSSDPSPDTATPTTPTTPSESADQHSDPNLVAHVKIAA